MKPAQHLGMSWFLSPTVRRLIATFLLLFDLSEEPGSGPSFLSLTDTDDDAVAEICTQDDFWWGSAKSCATINDAVRPALDATRAADESPGGAPPIIDSASAGNPGICHCVIITVNLDAVPPSGDIPLDIALSEHGPPPFGERLLHRNNYIGQKRDIVLIV